MVQVQASLALVQSPVATPSPPDSHGRVPFSHQALDGLKNLSPRTKNALTDRKKLADLARTYEADKIIRWNPRMVSDISQSAPVVAFFD